MAFRIRPHLRRGAAAILIAAISLALPVSPVVAGPPFLTDDPIPTDKGKWEIFLFDETEHPEGVYEVESGLDINYGAARDLQLTVVLPVEFADEKPKGPHVSGLELGAKYQFLHQPEGGLLPNASFYPQLSVPIRKDEGGSHKVGLALPIYVQNDFGKWSLFGGGGYVINPGAGHHDYWTVGYAVQRELSDRMSLGADIYHESRSETDGAASSEIEVGGSYSLSDHWSLLGAVHKEIQHPHEHGSVGFYLGLAFAN